MGRDRGICFSSWTMVDLYSLFPFPSSMGMGSWALAWDLRDLRDRPCFRLIRLFLLEVDLLLCVQKGFLM